VFQDAHKEDYNEPILAMPLIRSFRKEFLSFCKLKKKKNVYFKKGKKQEGF
jgi:hypothetical protein